MATKWAKTASGWVLLDTKSNVPPSTALLEDDVLTASSSRLQTTMASPVTPHTLSASFSVLIASTSAAAGGLYLSMFTQTFTNNIDTRTVIVIYTGGAGAEVEWARVPCGNRNPAQNLIVPGLIPAGTRVTAKVQGAVASQSFIIGASLLPLLPSTIAAPITYGVDLATSKGTVLTAPGSLNTKGNWTVMSASTASRIGVLSIFLQLNGVTSANATGMLVDIGTGAASSEVVLVSNIYLALNTSEQIAFMSPTSFQVDIPAGTRLVVRYARASSANQLDCALVAAPWSG